MKNSIKLVYAVLVCLVSLNGFCFSEPNVEVTPGKVCSESDPDFTGYRYPAHVAYCRRKVSEAEKEKVAAAYRVPKKDWSKYEFDHLIPLAAGGSNDIANIWPQPLDEAHQKDVVEQDVFDKLSRGEINQDQAVQEIWAWFQSLNVAAPQ